MKLHDQDKETSSSNPTWVQRLEHPIFGAGKIVKNIGVETATSSHNRTRESRRIVDAKEAEV